MNNRFSDLSPQSWATLLPYITFWSAGAVIDINTSINAKLPIETTGFMAIAEYAIIYAVLLDDKALLKDLCQHGADLTVRGYYATQRNKTPLEVGVEYGRAGIVKKLIKYGAEVPQDLKVPSSNPCTNPVTFFWSLKERCYGREVNYQAIDALLYSSKVKTL